jgi:hypothetical protein
LAIWTADWRFGLGIGDLDCRLAIGLPIGRFGLSIADVTREWQSPILNGIVNRQSSIESPIVNPNRQSVIVNP